MKLAVCALSLLAGLPSPMSAQISITLPRLQRPAVRATLGPIAVVATLGGHRVSVRAARAPRRTRLSSPTIASLRARFSGTS